MVKYLILLLDKTSTSYCHWENLDHESQLISIGDLKAGILYGMKENLLIQFVYPDYELPLDYKEIIDSIDHYDIISSQCEDNSLLTSANIVVFNNWTEFESYVFGPNQAYVLRTSKKDFFDRHKLLTGVLDKANRLNVVITDIETFTDSDFEIYKQALSDISTALKMLFASGKSPQLNLLTDRIMLAEMNNCNAGWENITLAPDGMFYVCPAFFHEQSYNIGSLENGLDIKNPQLYRLDYAPICRHCEAYQCRRCIWFNQKTTLAVNIPSYEQCVMAHIERNASRELLRNLQKRGMFLSNTDIPEISYLDPFDKKRFW